MFLFLFFAVVGVGVSAILWVHDCDSPLILLALHDVDD